MPQVKDSFKGVPPLKVTIPTTMAAASAGFLIGGPAGGAIGLIGGAASSFYFYSNKPQNRKIRKWKI